VYPCEVADGSSLAEPWDDSSSAEALGSLTAGTWQPRRTLRVVGVGGGDVRRRGAAQTDV
jgi:hypothetical protein